jgi:hypothetical protein
MESKSLSVAKRAKGRVNCTVETARPPPEKIRCAIVTIVFLAEWMVSGVEWER